MTQWTLASRAAKMNSSAIREILKLTDRPGIISMAGGLPSPQTFPISAFQAACNTVLERDGAAALQYSTTEGLPALRQAVADFLPWDVDPEQVLDRQRLATGPGFDRQDLFGQRQPCAR